MSKEKTYTWKEAQKAWFIIWEKEKYSKKLKRLLQQAKNYKKYLPKFAKEAMNIAKRFNDDVEMLEEFAYRGTAKKVFSLPYTEVIKRHKKVNDTWTEFVNFTRRQDVYEALSNHNSKIRAKNRQHQNEMTQAIKQREEENEVFIQKLKNNELDEEYTKTYGKMWQVFKESIIKENERGKEIKELLKKKIRIDPSVYTPSTKTNKRKY